LTTASQLSIAKTAIYSLNLLCLKGGIRGAGLRLLTKWFWVDVAATLAGVYITFVFNYLRVIYPGDIRHFGGTSALCVNTRWNFSLMG
jgi:hypothetical protein